MTPIHAFIGCFSILRLPSRVPPNSKIVTEKKRNIGPPFYNRLNDQTWPFYIISKKICKHVSSSKTPDLVIRVR